jgi:hypothetical protein
LIRRSDRAGLVEGGRDALEVPQERLEEEIARDDQNDRDDETH